MEMCVCINRVCVSYDNLSEDDIIVLSVRE